MKALVDQLSAQMEKMELGHLSFETGEPMTDEQLGTLNKALRMTKDKSYRPYCLRCTLGPRVALQNDGFKCWHCGNVFGFDLRPHVVHRCSTLLCGAESSWRRPRPFAMHEWENKCQTCFDRNDHVPAFWERILSPVSQHKPV